MSTRVGRVIESANEIQSIANDIAPLVSEVFSLSWFVLVCVQPVIRYKSWKAARRSPREIVFRRSRASDTFLSFVFSDLLFLCVRVLCSQGQLSFYTSHYLFMRFQKVHCSRSEHTPCRAQNVPARALGWTFIESHEKPRDTWDKSSKRRNLLIVI